MPRPDHAVLRAVSLLVVVFSKVQGACVHLDQLEVVLLGGLRDAFTRSPPSAEGGNKRTVLAAQCDYVRVRLVDVLVELGARKNSVCLRPIASASPLTLSFSLAYCVMGSSSL